MTRLPQNIFSTKYNQPLTESESTHFNVLLDRLKDKLKKKYPNYFFDSISVNQPFELEGLDVTQVGDDGVIGESVRLLFSNQLLTEDIQSPTPYVVSYYFNFEDYVTLSQRITNVMDKLFNLPLKSFGYYEIKAEALSFISFKEPYHYTRYGKEGDKYSFKKGMITTRCDAENVQEFTMQLAEKLDKVQDLKVLEYIASNESEACYIVVQHFVIPMKKMKISIRNHPINTQSQMVFYLYNYESYDELEERLIRVIEEFDWDNYVFNSYKYFDVEKEDIHYKRVGDDLVVYSEEQRAYVEGTRKERFQSKHYKPLIVHPAEKERFMKFNQLKT